MTACESPLTLECHSCLPGRSAARTVMASATPVQQEVEREIFLVAMRSLLIAAEAAAATAHRLTGAPWPP